MNDVLADAARGHGQCPIEAEESAHMLEVRPKLGQGLTAAHFKIAIEIIKYRHDHHPFLAGSQESAET
jgi:hypothetical protein